MQATLKLLGVKTTNQQAQWNPTQPGHKYQIVGGNNNQSNTITKHQQAQWNHFELDEGEVHRRFIVPEGGEQ